MLRIILGISRDNFCLRHCINFNTLTSIELDRLKISGKQLKKIVEAFAKDGLHVNPAWITDGKGEPPSRMLLPDQSAYGQFLENWAHFFTNHEQSVITLIHEDYMEPYYAAGDLVGGTWHVYPEFLVGKRCIVLLDKQLHVGIFFQDKNSGTLIPANSKLASKQVIFPLINAKIAEISWHINKGCHQIPELSALENENFTKSTHNRMLNSASVIR